MLLDIMMFVGKAGKERKRNFVFSVCVIVCGIGLKGNPEIGEVRESYVNAVSLNEIYEPVRATKLNILNYVLGFSFAGAALLGIVLGYLV